MAVVVAAVARRPGQPVAAHGAAHTRGLGEERRWKKAGGGGDLDRGLGGTFFDKRGRVDGGVVGGVGADASGSVGFITRATTINLVVAWVYNPLYYYGWSREARWKSLSSSEG